jgi:hypothetical protein
VTAAAAAGPSGDAAGGTVDGSAAGTVADDRAARSGAPVPDGARTVEVLPGVTGGWLAATAASDAEGDLSWRSGDLRFHVGGRISLAKALAVARSLDEVEPDDPRLR